MISREIAKKENLEEMAITEPRNDQTMTAKGRHDQGDDASMWTPVEKHVLSSRRKLGNYVSEPNNPPCDGIIDQIYDSCQNRTHEPSDESPVKQQYEPNNPWCHERNDSQQLNCSDGSQNSRKLRDGSGPTHITL